MGDGEGPSLDVTWKLTFDEESGSHSLSERGAWTAETPRRSQLGNPCNGWRVSKEHGALRRELWTQSDEAGLGGPGKGFGFYKCDEKPLEGFQCGMT